MTSTRRTSILSTLLLLFLAAQSLAAHASDRNPDHFPLQVQVVYRSGHRHHHGYFFGEGKGNVIEANQINGMEFSFSCEYKFNDSATDEYYPARWKHPGETLDILMGEFGSETRTHTCQLKVLLKDVVYRKVNGHTVSMSPQEYAALEDARIERNQSLAPADLDPNHYPLHVSLLRITWKDSLGGLQTGTGQADLIGQSGLNAVDFSVHCPVRIEPTPAGRYLVAQWLQPGAKMLLLLPSILVDGAPGATCELNTIVQPDVYVREGGTVKAVSQQEYRTKYAVANQ